jgi:hypothetical protein
MLISASRSSNAWRSFRIGPFAYVSDVFQPIIRHRNNRIAELRPHSVPLLTLPALRGGTPEKKRRGLPRYCDIFRVDGDYRLSCDSRAADFPNSAAY